MSADDFQTKYASVMESMLKSAIAETTKLFENMVDELKAEISQIKKENADLKSKCFQYEVAKSQPVDRSEESDTQPGQSDDSGKCDSSIQCDLVPYRTVLVEQCQPLVESPQQNQEQQSTHDSVGYTWQEHNYVSNGCRDPKIVHVKQEESYSGSDCLQSSLKQEEEESDLISEQLSSKTGASVRDEHEESRFSKESSIEQTSSQKRDATQIVLQLPCFRTDSSSQVAQNQPSGLNHSLVISLTDAFREDIKEENEVYQMTTKMGTSEDLRTQKQQLVPEEYHLDKASLIDEQTEGTVKQHVDVACTTDQLAESELIRKEVVNEEIKGNVADVADPNPARRRRGRPPKKRNVKQNSPKTQKKVGAQAAVNTSPSEPSEASASEILETYSSLSPPSKCNANTSAKEKKSKTHSPPPKQPPLKSSQLFLEVEKERTEVRVFRASSASKTTNPPQSESPQASSGLLKESQSSVSLQDAMLLIEAMNQSTLENTFSLTQVTSQPQTHFVPLAGPTETLAVQQRPLVEIHHTTDTHDVSSNMTGTGLSNDTVPQNEEMISKQPQLVPILNNTTLPVLSALSSTAATQTVIQSLPLPRLKVGSPTNVPRTIIILPRPALSFSSLNTLDASTTQSSTVDSTASQMVITAPPSPGLELSCEKPSHSSNTPNTIKVTYRKLDPVSPTQSTTILADHHLLISASKKLTIVPKSFIAVKQNTAEPEAPVNDPEPEATVDNPEPQTPVNILELEAPADNPESEATADKPEPDVTGNTVEPETSFDTLEPKAPVYTPEPEALVSTSEPEAPIYTPEPEALVSTSEPEALVSTPESEAPVYTSEPEALVSTPESEAPVYTSEPEALVSTPESEAPVNTLEPEAHIDTPEPETCVYTLEPEAPVYTLEPEASVTTPELEAPANTLEPKAHVESPEPEAHTNTPEPEASTHASEPEAFVNTFELKSFADTPKPEAYFDSPEPETHLDSPEPETHLDSPEAKAHVDTPEAKAHVDTPEAKAHVDTPEAKAHVDTPEAKAHVDTPEPEAHVDTPEPETHIDSPKTEAHVESEAHIDSPEPDAHVSLSTTQLNVMSEEPSLTAADTNLLPKKNKTTGGPQYSNQSASETASEPFSPLTDFSSSTEMSVKEVQTSVSSILPSTTEQKFCAVVRLTRLPFPVSTKKSFSVSSLQAKGFSFISEKQSKPSISLSVLSDIKAAQGSQAVASKITALPCEPLTFNQQTTDLAQDTILSEGEEDQKEGLVLPASINPDDTSDPRSRITKTQFLEQLSVTLQKKSSSNESLDASKTRTSDQKKYSIVSRLRSHLKPLLKARRIATEQVTDNQTENCVKTPKKPRLDSDNLNVNKTAKEPVSSGKLDVSDDATPLNTVTTTRKSGQCKVNDSPTKIVCERVFVSLRKFDSTSTAESFKRLCSDTDIGSPSKKTKSSSTSPKRSTTAGSSPENTTIVKEGNTSLKESGSPSCSTFIQVSPCTKLIKRESSSFSPGRCSISKVNASEKNMSKTHFPLTKDHKKAKNTTSPEMTQRLTPEKKAKLVKGCQSTKTVKLPKTARTRGKYKAKSSNSEKPKRQNKNNWVVKKCIAKIWYPPVLPPDEVPSTEIIKAPRLKVEYRVPVIPLHPEPIVSPLQPLSFIGRHLLRHQCGECGRVFNSSNALESHVSLHNLNRPFTCKLCAKYFPDAVTFKRHDRVHRNGRIHVCETCGKGFVYRFGLSKHVQMVHGRIKPFICQVCNKGFFNKRDVEIHIRIHTGEKPFQCEICERRFTRKVELNVHLRWHNGEKRHWCSYCGKGFLDANNLKRHKYIHTGEKPFSCPLCPKNFTQTGHLKKHLQSMHTDANI